MFTTRINQYNLRRLNFLRSFCKTSKTAVAGAQILFVAFGAMVLVPLLTGLNPTPGSNRRRLGHLVVSNWLPNVKCRFSSVLLCLIAPIIYSVKEWGLPSTMFGLFAAGFMYFIFAALIRWRGLDAVHKLLPPVVIGPVIMVIGLSVASEANKMAMGQSGGKQVIDYIDSLILSGFTFAVTVIVSVFGSSKMMKLIPILIGVASV